MSQIRRTRVTPIFQGTRFFKFHLKPICNQLISVDVGKSNTLDVFCDLLSTSAK